MLNRRSVLAGGLAASLPGISTTDEASLHCAPAIDLRRMEDFIPEGPRYVPPRPMIELTKFVPSDRFTPQEIGAVLAFEADYDGLACLRRDDPEYRLLMHAAIGKGHSIRRGRPLTRPMINLFDP